MKITKKQFLNDTHLPESLVNAVIKQMGTYAEFQETAIDVTNHGASGGVSGFIYHTETIPFAEANKKELMQTCEEMAESCGESGALELIAGFNALSGDYSQSEIADGIYNNDSEHIT